MTDHVHLLLTPEQATSVPRLIVSVGRRHFQYINHTYGRTGTLWDSRHKSSLVQVETYLLLCQRYIELNPVRAGMVCDPADYPWSSYRANALGQANAILSPLTPSTSPLQRMTSRDARSIETSSAPH
jgi:putative transposase